MSKPLPLQLIASLQGLPGFDQQAFERVHGSGEQISSIRLNLAKISPANCLLPVEDSIGWAEGAYYLSERPSFTFDPLFHAGCYYVQEASSMFLEQALRQTVDLSRSLKVLDLCAAPGGKSTHIQSLISKESLLVSNEVIRSRANVLRDNIIKWGAQNVVVTNNDPGDISKLEGYFDVIIVDAPCSGSGLFRRDPEAIDEWSENNVELCSQRQQRILADIWPALKKDGVLIYSTCSYSDQEDEQIMDWIGKEWEAENQALELKNEWGIVKTLSMNGFLGYRFWPDKVKGEGFFMAVFRKKRGSGEITVRSRNRLAPVTRQELQLINHLAVVEGNDFVKHDTTVYAWPEILSADFSFLHEKLHLVYSGTRVGELMRDKLVPDHAIAMSPLIAPGVNSAQFDKEQSIRYLQRKDINVAVNQKGWQLVTYLQHPLGWINALPNRINNYYPKELRILKDS